ncbi:MAG TPA: phospho-sugar mutase, partial [Opitutaceae bacterium]
PPKAFEGVKVTEFRDYGRETIYDADGEPIPKQDLYVVTLSNGYRYAARGSGTEPKMKFYLFASEKAADATGLPALKAKVRSDLDQLRSLIEADARRRAES